MQSNVIDLILFMVRMLRLGHSLNDIQNEKKLNQYTQSEVSAAYSWVMQRLDDGAERFSDKKSVKSMRVLHQAERMMIDKEAQGFLMDLYGNGIINYEQLEQIIEVSMMNNFEKTDLEKIKKLISHLLFGDETFRKSATVVYLNGNESVN